MTLARITTSEFAGLRAIVTGGASGIGLATAMMLAERGARVASLDLQPDVPAPIVGVRCDVADDSSVRAAVAEVVDRFGGLDILVNNAGIGSQGMIADNPDEEWLRSYDINVLGIVRVTRAALDSLRASDHAAIVNTCSIAATAGLPERACYSATNGAVLALTRAMAVDHVRRWHPRQLPQPRHGRHIVDPAAARSGRRPGSRAGRVERPPADGPARPRRRGGRRDLSSRQPTGREHHRNRRGGRGLSVRQAPAPMTTEPANSQRDIPAGQPQQRMALHTRLRPDAIATYEAEHEVIPADLDAALRDAGVTSWRIWRDGVDLFHDVECDDIERMWSFLEGHPANIPWQQQISRLLDLNIDYSTGDGALHLVWELPAEPAE